MPGEYPCRVDGCPDVFLSPQGEAAHFGKAHRSSSFDADIILLAKMGNELMNLKEDIQAAERRAEVYQELADLIRESIRSRRLETSILAEKIKALRLRYAEAGIPLEVKA